MEGCSFTIGTPAQPEIIFGNNPTIIATILYNQVLIDSTMRGHVTPIVTVQWAKS